MRTSSRSFELGALLLLALSCAPIFFIVGCANGPSSWGIGWDESRRVYVDEVNQLLHHDLPRVLRENDLDKLLALYTRDARSSGELRSAKRELLEPYREIVRAHSVITEASPIQLGASANATIEVQLHGITQDGSRRSRFVAFDVSCVREAGVWRIASEKVTSSRIATNMPTIYRDESADRGIWNTPAVIEVPDHDGARQPYPAGTGLAVGDVNDDGHDDLYLTNGSECRLFINRGDGQFDDVTAAAGCDGKAGGGDARLALLCDFDSDGRTDIFVGKIYAPNLLYRQNADGTFTDVTAESGLVPTIETNAATAAAAAADTTAVAVAAAVAAAAASALPHR